MRRNALLATLAAASLLLAPSSEAVELKIATLAPDGSFWMNEARAAADEVARRTDGRVSFRFYPGGTMGDDSAVLRKMRIGQLHGGVFLAGSFAQSVPDIQLYQLPLLFGSYAEVDAVRGELDATLIAALEAAGYHSFGFIEGGFAYLYLTKKAATFDEVKGRKAWIPENDTIGRVLAEEASLSPVPLGLADVLTGLQTGLIDVVTGPPVAAVALQWFTKVSTMMDLPVIYTYGCVAVSDRAWSGIAEGDRKVVDETFGRMTRTLDRRAREDNLAAKRALQEQGVELVVASGDTARRWHEVAARSAARLVDKLGLDRELLSRIESKLASFRKSAAADAAATK